MARRTAVRGHPGGRAASGRACGRRKHDELTKDSDDDVGGARSVENQQTKQRRKKHRPRVEDDRTSVEAEAFVGREVEDMHREEESSPVGDDDMGGEVLDNADGAKEDDDLPETGTNPVSADNPDGQRNSAGGGFVPRTVLAAPRSVVGGGSTTSSLQLGSVAGDAATFVSALSKSSCQSKKKGDMDIDKRQKYGEVKSAVRNSVFRAIKFLGKANSKELQWDRQIAEIVYSYLNMNNLESAKKKIWWEEDNNLVSRWIAETIAMKRSEVTQGIHKRFLGEFSGGISEGRRVSLTANIPLYQIL